MRNTYSTGGVVLNKEGKVLVVNQRGISWSLPKGHIEKGESEIETAKREIHEESGVKNLKLIKKLGTYSRPKMTSEKIDSKEEMKNITIFLFTTPDTKLAPIDPKNPEARWVDIDQVESLLTHPLDKAFFRKIQSQIKV